MRFSRDKLILLGLAALYETAQRATAEPMRPGFVLRAVFAMLYQLSDGVHPGLYRRTISAAAG